MFQATRRRLALWYSAVTAVLLLLFASGVYLYVRNTLIERMDDTLNHVVEVVERSLAIEPQTSPPRAFAKQDFVASGFRVDIDASFRHNDAVDVEDDRIDLEWFNPQGELLWSTLSEPLNLPLHPNRRGETVQVAHPAILKPAPPTEAVLATQVAIAPAPLQLRQVTEKVQLDGRLLGYLRVSHPWFEVTKPTRRLLLDLSLGISLVAVSVATLGWMLSGLAMEPVRQSYQRLKQFTADASHELRSPVATIQTNVQVALADPSLDAATKQQFQVIERLTRRMGRLVNDLLFLARQDSGIIQSQWQRCDLDGLLVEVVEEQRAIAEEKGITLQLHFHDPELATIDAKNSGVDVTSTMSNTDLQADDWFALQGDPQQLARLFTNLVANALQYAHASSTVTLDLSRQVPTNRAQAAALQVTICDRGIGISKTALPHIFDRFYRADPARTHSRESGSGLGLAIAQTIVDKHEGQIRIDSTEAEGTTVTVTLPQKAKA